MPALRQFTKTCFYKVLKHSAGILGGVHSLRAVPHTEIKIPVIVYHKISTLKCGIDAFFNVPPDLFEAHMRFLANSQYQVISLNEVYEIIRNKKSITRPVVAISFDDGYANNFRHAYPLLKKYKFPATFFLTGKYTGNGNIYPWDRENLVRQPDIYDDVRILSWKEIEEMKGSDLMGFGSHSMSHPHLAQLSGSEIEYELEASKELLEKKIGIPVDFFAYPGGMKKYGDLNETTNTLLPSKGYRMAFTSEMGRNSLHQNLFSMKRIGMCSQDTLPLFKAKISGACDWLKYAQDSFQRIFNNVF